MKGNCTILIQILTIVITMEDTKRYFIQQYGTTEKCADILLKIFGDILFDDEGVYLYKYGYGRYRYAYLIDYIDKTDEKNEQNQKNQTKKYKKDEGTENESKLSITGFPHSLFGFPNMVFLPSIKGRRFSLVKRIRIHSPKYYLCKGQGEILKHTSYYIKVSGFILESIIFLITVWLSQGIAEAAIVEFIINIIRPHIFKIKAFEMCVLINLILEPEFNKTPFTVDRIYNFYKEFENECMNDSDKWDCTYKSNKSCLLTVENIKEIVDSLLQKNIISRSEDGYLIRNI